MLFGTRLAPNRTMSLSVIRSFSLSRSNSAVDESPRIRAGVAHCAVFSGLPLAGIERVALASTLKKSSEGSTIYRRGEAALHLVWVISGEVKESMTGIGGREVTLRSHHAGAVLGDSVVGTGCVRAADTVALSSTETLWLPNHELAHLLRDYPQVAINLLSISSDRIRQAEKTIAQFALLDVPDRLAVQLADLAMTEGTCDQAGRMLKTRPTQQELANRVGSCRETVSRAMNQMVRDGLLIARGRALLVTHAMLARVAGARAS